MRIAFVTILVLLSLPGIAEEDPSPCVDRLVARLGGDTVEEREAAQRDLIALGARAEEAVRKARDATSDPEVRLRLEAVLRAYSVCGEEQYALDRIHADEPFPRLKFATQGLSGPAHPSFLAIVDAISGWSGIPIEAYDGDEEIALILNRPAVDVRTPEIANHDIERWMAEFFYPLSLMWVVDGERVVLVRPTVRILLTLLAKDPGDPSPLAVSSLLAWDQNLRPEWNRPWYMVSALSQAGADARERWLTEFRAIAVDRRQTEHDRIAALAGVRAFYARCGEEQPDVDQVFAEVVFQAEVSARVRRSAIDGLVVGLTAESQETVLSILESGPADLRADLLDALALAEGWSQTASRRLQDDANRRRRYLATLRFLCADEETDVESASRAAFLRACAGDECAGEEISGRNPPTSLQAAYDYMVAVFGTLGPRDARGALSFRSDLRPEARALYLIARPGDDVAAARDVIGMLRDPAVVVRRMALSHPALQRAVAQPSHPLHDAALVGVEEREKRDVNLWVRIIASQVLHPGLPEMESPNPLEPWQ